VRHVRGASEHAVRARRATDDVGRRAAGGCPRRCCRQHDVDDECGEGQCDEAPDERCPVISVAQPEHSGDDIGQHKKRHVDAADDHLPPRGLGHLDALLQPHRGDGAEEQPPVGLRLEMPQGGRSQQCCRAPAEVIDHQDKGERKPVAHDGEDLVPSTDAGRDKSGGDIQQQQFAIEGQPVCQRSVGHDEGPDRHRHPPGKRQPTLPGFVGVEVKIGDGFGARHRGEVRPFWPTEQPAGNRLWVGLEASDSAISCYCHQSNPIRFRLFSIRSFL
jgi:hypothetical protein